MAPLWITLLRQNEEGTVQGASEADRPWLLATLQGGLNELSQRLRGFSWTSQVTDVHPQAHVSWLTASLSGFRFGERRSCLLLLSHPMMSCNGCLLR